MLFGPLRLSMSPALGHGPYVRLMLDGEGLALLMLLRLLELLMSEALGHGRSPGASSDQPLRSSA
jgi:hypothetical protein